jgi:O-antigen ligase
MVVTSPWPMGGALSWAGLTLTLGALATSAGVLAWQAWRGHVCMPPAPFWPLFALVGLGCLQLVPVPPQIHALVAPGSASLWHPAEPAAARVLGSSWRPISVYPTATRQWLAWALGLLTLATLALPALSERRLARRAVVVVVAGGLLVAVYGIVSHVLFGPLLYGRIPVPTVSPFGPFVSKNHFAGYVEMVALLALGLAVGLADESRRSHSALSWVGSRGAGPVMAAAGASLAMALAVLASQSRGGVLSLGAGGAAFVCVRALVRHRARARILAPAVGAALVAAALLAVVPSDTRARIASLGAPTSDASGAYRLGIWRDTLRVFGSSPWLGQGFGAYADALPRSKTVAGELRVEHAENDVLELLAEGGFAAALLAGVGVAWLVSRTRRNLTRAHSKLERSLLTGVAGGLVALFVHSLVDFNLRLPASASVAVLLLAMGVGNDSANERGAWSARLVGAMAAGALVAVVVATLLVPRQAVGAPNLERLSSAIAGRAAGLLRIEQADLEVRSYLGQRPADAEGWAILAWLRAATHLREEGAALAHYANSLDPRHAVLGAYAEELTRAQAVSTR